MFSVNPRLSVQTSSGWNMLSATPGQQREAKRWVAWRYSRDDHDPRGDWLIPSSGKSNGRSSLDGRSSKGSGGSQSSCCNSGHGG